MKNVKSAVLLFLVLALFVISPSANTLQAVDLAVLKSGKDMEDIMNKMGFALYDYHELNYSKGDITVTITILVPEKTFKELGFFRIRKQFIREVAIRYLYFDQERGVNYYNLAILSNPSTVIQWQIEGEEIERLKKAFSKAFLPNV